MKKRSVTLAGHRTSVLLEDEYWDSLEEIALKRGCSLQKLVETVDAARAGANLSSALRVFVLNHYRAS